MTFRGNEFAERYMIISIKGVIWHREMLRRAAMKALASSPLPVPGGAVRDLPVETRSALLSAVLEDDDFLLRHRGEIPARVVEAIEERVWEIFRGF
jgi:hypothetical protein